MQIFLILWLAISVFAVGLRIDSWPVSYLPMFTQYKSAEQIHIYKTRVLDKDGRVLFEQNEYRLPVIRFFETKTNPLNEETQKQFTHAWWKFNQPALEKNPEQAHTLSVLAVGPTTTVEVLRHSLLTEAAP